MSGQLNGNAAAMPQDNAPKAVPAPAPVTPPHAPKPAQKNYILDIKPGMTEQEAFFLALSMTMILTGTVPPRYADRKFNLSEETANRIFEVSMRHFEPLQE
jgi:hypothetical protein